MKTKMTSLRTALQLGLLFFCVRFVTAITFGSIAVYLSHTPKIDYHYLWPEFTILAILQSLGAMTDIGLIFGVITKKKWPILIWNCSQFVVGTLICCTMIPLVTLKAIKEIEDEKLSVVR